MYIYCGLISPPPPPRTTIYPQAEYQEFANRHSLYYPTAIPSTLHPSFPHAPPSFPHCSPVVPALLPRRSRIPPVIPAKAGIHEAAGEATQPLSLEG